MFFLLPLARYLLPLARYLWIFSAIIQASLLFLAVKRRLYQQFPFFTVYLAWAFCKTITLLFMDHLSFFTGEQYFYAFTVGRAGVAVLNFGVLYELFKVLCDYPAARRLGATLLRSASLILLLFAIALAWLVPATGEGKRMAALYLCERTVSILQIGLLLFLFVFSRYLGISWQSHAFGIAFGFGILASVSLATAAIRSQVEPIARNGLSDAIAVIVESTSLCCNAIWFLYLLLPKSLPSRAARLPDHDLETWNQELERLLQR